MRVVIVDDHTVVRQSIALMLDQEADIEVVGEAADGKRAIELVREVTPDVVLMDINMPVLDGIDATRAICAEYPDVRVIGLSMQERAEQAQHMLDAGAAGYVCKTESPDTLLAAIRRCGTA